MSYNMYWLRMEMEAELRRQSKNNNKFIFDDSPTSNYVPTKEDKENWIREYFKTNTMENKEIKRTYSDSDPYGEENWED